MKVAKSIVDFTLHLTHDYLAFNVKSRIDFATLIIIIVIIIVNIIVIIIIMYASFLKKIKKM